MPVNYEGVIDYVLSEAEKDGVTPDPVEVMQVAARGLTSAGVKIDPNHMAGLSDAARRRLVPQEQQGAASALAESAYRAGIVQPLGGIDTRILGNEPDIIQANDRANAQLEAEHPAASFVGGSVGSVAAPFIGTAAGALAGTAVAPGPGTLIGGLAGGAVASMPSTLGNDVSRELQGRGTGNRIGNAALETGFSMVPGMGPAAGTLAKRVGINAVEGAIMGTGQSTTQQGLDLATGDREKFSAGEALLSGTGGAMSGGALAPLGGPGDSQARQINMDQLLAPQQETTALSAASANDTAVRQRMGVQDAQQSAVADTLATQRYQQGRNDAQQQAVAATREARMPGKLAEAEQLHRDIREQDAKEAAIGSEYESAVRQNLGEQNARDSAVDSTREAQSYLQRDDAAQLRRNVEAQDAKEASYGTNYEADKLLQQQMSDRVAAVRQKRIDDAVAAEKSRIADEEAQRQLDEEAHANENAAYEKQYEDEARAFAEKHNLNPDQVISDVRAARATERQTGDPEVNKVLRAPDMMDADTRGVVGRDDGLDVSPMDEPPAVAHARTEVEKAQLVRENLRRQAENARAAEVQNTVDLKRPAVAAPDERALAKAAVAAAHKANKIDKQTAKRLTLELQTRDITAQRAEQIRAAHEHSVENLIPSHRTFGDDAEGTYPTLEQQTGREFDQHADAPIDTLSPKARAFVDAQSPKMRAALQESLDHLQQYPDPKGDLGNLQNVVHALENPVVKRGTGKAREGAALNPAAALVGASKAVAKGVGKGVTAINSATKEPKKFVGRQVTSLRDMFFDDAAGRLKNSQSPAVRDVGDKFNSALGHGRDSQTRMHDRIDRATQNASVMSKSEAKELRALNAPYKDPKTGRVSSKLHDLVTRKTVNDPRDTPLMKRIKEAFTEVNDVTQQEMHAQGVPIRSNAHAGVGVLRQHMTSEASSSLGNKDVPFRDALVKKIADTNVHPTGPKKGQNYTVDEVLADLVGTNLTHNASVRRDALENGRKYVLPHYVEVNGKIRQVLSLDPRQYVRNTAGSATRRVGMVKAFGPDVSAESIHKMVSNDEHYDQKATARMLDAYNGVPHGDDALDSGAFSHGVRAAKAAFSSIKTTVAAAYGPGEVFSMIGQVPAHHGLVGALNAVKHPNRAVQEGGIEADIKNKVDLRGKVSPALENFASGVRRASGNNVVNRSTHILAYEGGRSWAMDMKDAGAASKSDLAYMEVNRIPSYIQDAFKDGHANQADVASLARAVAENYSGQKSNMAEQGRLSRNAMVKTWGPMFLRYGENRVRNFLRSWDTAAKAWNKGDHILAGRILGSRLTGYTISAAAATAISQVIRYGVESLGMAMEAGEMAPLIGNFFGGSWSDLIYRNTNEDSATKIANSAVWPLAAASEAFNVAAGKKSAVDVVPLAARVRDLVEGRDVAGDKAYSLYWKAQKPRGGTSSNPDRAGARSDIRRMLMRKDYVGATKLVNEYTSQLSRADRMTFLRNSKLLPDKIEEKRQLHKEIGPTAYNLIAGHDETINQLMGK